MSYNSILRQDIQKIDWTDIDILWDDFATTTKMAMRPGNLKKKAAYYISATNLNYLDRRTVRELSNKKRKLRRSFRKIERARSHALAKQINWYLNFINK